MDKNNGKLVEFDIEPFSLPNCEANEVWFEEARDINKVIITFKNKIPDKIVLSYLVQSWPETRIEERILSDPPIRFGGIQIDDWFNTKWRASKINLRKIDKSKIEITFKELISEFPGFKDYNVKFRRTLGVRIDVKNKSEIKKIRIFTVSKTTKSVLLVKLNSGRKTNTKQIELFGYNSVIEKITAVKGSYVNGNLVKLLNNPEQIFRITVRHMIPAHTYCNDDAYVTFALNDDKFTISLVSLESEGPIWFYEKGVYITKDEDKTEFLDYLNKCKNKKTITDMVKEMPEQSFAGAYYGQSKSHSVSYTLGCKYARQRFWLESNGDIILPDKNLKRMPSNDSKRYKNKSSGRFFFGLEHWYAVSCFTDVILSLVYNVHMKKDNIELEQKSFAVPLLCNISEKEMVCDDTIVLLVKFRFKNSGKETSRAELPVNYSSDSTISASPYNNTIKRKSDKAHNDYLIPVSKFDELTIKNDRVYSIYNSEEILRFSYKTVMDVVKCKNGLLFTKEMEPGDDCELILKIPYVSLETNDEFIALKKLGFDSSYKQVKDFWGVETTKGASVITPEPHLNALYKAHLMHVGVSDINMPDKSGFINTSVGASVYGNFCNESSMIINDLDQRGLHDEARRRLNIWIKYQGTVPLEGTFTDYKGLFYGAGGFEGGNSYTQHHGWVLWCLSEHYFLANDVEWFESIADSVIEGVEWVFRQRKNTMKKLPHSRGWEYGFLPASGLEDVGDFQYWISNNLLMWRGVEWSARALESINHPKAEYVRKEADKYKKDIIKGVEIARQHTSLVRLRNGHWVPHYPTKVYSRSRGIGWMREVLEGAIYLLLSGLYDSKSRQAKWILNDYQDNLYMNPPYGLIISHFGKKWFSKGGFSIQPNLLAGLLPYFIRGESEIYIWSFFNAWCACYREEINAMIEFPGNLLDATGPVIKTSDEANAVTWLRYMFVFAYNEVLYLGRAIPREWLKDNNTIGATGVVTCFGTISVEFKPEPEKKKIIAVVNLSIRQHPEKILIRFRHPEKAKIKSVLVNGKEYVKYDVLKEDVDITGYKDKVIIEANF